MAARTTAAAGDYSATGTWTGGVVPVAGDTLTVNHPVTITDARTVGHSPPAGDATAAIQVNGGAGGALTVSPTGTLVMRGDGKLTNAVLTINGIFEWDGSAAASPGAARYVWQVGTDHFQTSKVIIDGSPGSRAVIRSNAGGANGRFTGGEAFINGGNFDIDEAAFLRVGDDANDALVSWMGSDPGNMLRIHNAVFDTCGRIRNAVAMATDTIFDLQGVTFKNSLHVTYNTDFNVGDVPAGTGMRRIDGCVFDKQMRAIAYGSSSLTITNTLFMRPPELTSAAFSTGGMAWSTNLVRVPGPPDFIFNDDVADSYLLYDAVVTNPHGLHPAAGSSIAMTGWIIEFTGPDNSGDMIVMPVGGAPSTYTIRNNIKLPNGAGVNAGSLFSALGDAAVTIICDHNTAHIGGLVGGAAVGETYPGHAGMLQSLANNLFWDTLPRGHKLLAYAGTVANIITPANAHHNGGFNLLAGSNGNGYEGLSPASGYGTGDVSDDPQFVDDTRNFATWDGSIAGGAGSVAHGLAELAKRNDASGYIPAYTIAALIADVRAGFRPQNAAVHAASDSVAPSNGWMGAVEGAAGTVSGSIFRSRVIS